MNTQVKPSRKYQILETLALQLEKNPGARITTAKLAAELGLSEAALYRHFPSKADMFEGLIRFAEDTVFGLITRILGEERAASTRCEHIVTMVLTFTERNPGITRVLLGEALVGEHERLRGRSNQFFERIETQLRQVLREAELGQSERATAPPTVVANMLAAILEGRIARFARSGFERPPTHEWEAQWALLKPMLFRS
jgi:TetR/AcrR family transcriptional regulator